MAKLSAKNFSLPLIIGAALLTTNAFANDRDRDNPWYVSGFAEYYWSDDDKDVMKWNYVEDGPGLGVELGYILNENWDIRGELAHTWLDSNGPHDDDEFDRIGVDALYHFDDSPFYAVGGVKKFLQSKNFEAVNLGLGYRRALNDNLSIGAEGNVYRGIDDSVTDFGLKLGLTYFFGDKKAMQATPAPVAAAAVAAPAVVEKDTDGDGVYDSKDNCAGTPMTDKVDAAGCSVLAEESKTVELSINFANNSDEITAEHYEEIAAFADFMKRHSATKVEIGGHTSASGAASYNQTLSERRAKSVANILVEEHGIAADRVSAVGYGESQLKYEDSSKNRRIEAVVTAVEKVHVQR